MSLYEEKLRLDDEKKMPRLQDRLLREAIQQRIVPQEAMTLRDVVNGISDDDLRVLVKVAFEAINDTAACREIARLVEKGTGELLAFGVRVAEPLASLADKELGYYAFSIHVDKAWVEDRGVADKGCVAFHLDRDVDRAALERAIKKSEGEDAQLEFYDPTARQGQWFMVDWESSRQAGDVIEA